jgi:protein-L-isoaspartate(D-aspartate) O-methyltransferase
MEELVSKLIQDGVLVSEKVINAFININRKYFVLPEYEEEACNDYPLPIGFGQTISQPFTVAFMLELLDPEEDSKILDVGSGSGWTTAMLAEIAKNGQVFGVERIPELVALGQKNLSRYKFENAEILEAKNELGLKEEAPFDRILVSASAREIPEELIDQLKVGGIMVIPVEKCIFKVKKISNTEIEKERHEGFFFVPLK